MAKPRRDEGDGYVLLVHQRGTRMPRVVEANLRYVEIADGRLPHRAEGRRVVGLTRLVADDIAPVDVGLTKRELLNGLSVLRRVSSPSSASGMGRTRPAFDVLGLVLVECAATYVDSRGANSECPVFEIDVNPPLAGDLSASQTGKGEVPGVAIAVIGDAA